MVQQKISKNSGLYGKLRKAVSLSFVIFFIYILGWSFFDFDPFHIFEGIESLASIAPKYVDIAAFLYFLASAFERSRKYSRNGDEDEGVLAGILWLYAILALVVLLM